MTPGQFWAAMALFHATVLAAAWRVVPRWRDRARCRLPPGSWLRTLARDLGSLAVLTYVASLMAPVVTNLDDVARLRLGAISGRLMGQAIFGEAILVGIVLAVWHRRAARPGRASILGVAAAGLLAVLAGHTHGGQVVLPLFGPLWTASRLPRLYAGDLHDYRGIPLHVSRGVGMERGFAPPVRFFCPPEVCVLDVRLIIRRGRAEPQA